MNIKFRDVSMALLAASVLSLAACASTKDDSTMPPADSAPAPAEPSSATPPADSTAPPADATTTPPADSAAPTTP